MRTHSRWAFSPGFFPVLPCFFGVFLRISSEKMNPLRYAENQPELTPDFPVLKQATKKSRLIKGGFH
jgi:hypothetical protein